MHPDILASGTHLAPHARCCRARGHDGPHVTSSGGPLVYTWADRDAAGLAAHGD